MNLRRPVARAVLRAGIGLICGAALALSAAPVTVATNLWKFKFASRKLVYNISQTSPAVAPDGTLYTGTLDGTLYAVTPAGGEKWRFHAGREIRSSPAVAADGTVYFGARDRNFYAVTPAGKLKWRFATGAWVDSSPAIAEDGTVYFGSWDKNFYALNPDGALKWKFTVGAIVDSSAAVAADGTVYFGAHDRFFYALDAAGKVRWKFAAGGEIISSPALGADGAVYFTALDGNLYALNADGTERWRYHTGGTTASSPVLGAAGEVCVGDNVVTLVVSATGRFLWNSGSAVPMEASAVAIRDGFYFSLPWRQLGAVLPGDQRLWRADLAANVSAPLAVGADGTVYACAETFLYAFPPPGGAVPVAKSAWPMFRANPRHTGRVGD